MRESKIEAYLVKQVKALGGEVRKVQWIGRRGAPDRLVMLPKPAFNPITAMSRAARGKDYGPIWVELKATGVRAEAHQLREHTRMRKMGQRVEVVDSFERVDEVLS